MVTVSYLPIYSHSPCTHCCCIHRKAKFSGDQGSQELVLCKELSTLTRVLSCPQGLPQFFVVTITVSILYC